ncbi:MAG: hypothetical protein M3440_06975 [Chloroflexota bacterium]|nr:hypothetical protein [Chloroflexota bacterium]
MVNLLKVFDSQFAPEWSAIPGELMEMLAPSGTAYLTTRQRAALNRIAAGRWFLVRNSCGARCEGCNRIHAYMTIRCVEGPFNGLRQVYEWIKPQDNWDRDVSVQSGDYAVRGADMDMIVAISQADAATYNQRIRDRGGVPVIDQRPLRQEEIEEEQLRLRIVNRARYMRARAEAIERMERLYGD